ncbi:MAG: threonine aldolase family protein [Nitrospinota bacterium]
MRVTNPPIDLRSDTASRPSPSMRRAMAEAEVGDMALDEDPTVNGLQERACRLFEKEAAMFVPSGTMANQTALKAHTQPGDEVILERASHPVTSELAAGAMISGVQFMLLEGERGRLEPERVEEAIRPRGRGEPRTALLWVENTHNRGGGSIYELDRLRSLRRVADAHDIPVHLDGARIFNASVAADVPVAEYARYCESVNFCLSKGLGCPVGSLVLGSEGFIARAKRYRRMLGGNMRQAGLLAAAGLYALEHNVERLAEDHANARRLAERLAPVPGLRLVYDTTLTNIVFLDVSRTASSAEELAARLAARGVLFSVYGRTWLRAVTHLDVSAEDVERAADTVERELGGRAGAR